ncbi:MAG: ATP-binding protein [Pseudomonadota bacterium]|nr:MAG: ATP-binding protein [Pseudomonadota bacterium]
MKPRAIVAWSSGKDSAYALHVLRERAEVDVVALFTTVTAPFARVSMHGVRTELLREQAARAGLPLWEVEIPRPCSNAEYDAAMRRLVERARREDVQRIAFGDLFLEDVRRYREERLSGTGVEPMFPLWGIPTAALAKEMLNAGVEAVLTCIDPRKVPRALAGRRYDAALLDALPADVDPCGENGEFHTFVTAGPMLSAPIAVNVGPTVERDGFVFTDVTLRGAAPERRSV